MSISKNPRKTRNMPTNNENTELKETLHNLLAEKGISFDDLPALSKIPRRYLRAIFEGDIKNMPAAPYVHGYLDRIAKVLESDPSSLHSAYHGLELRSSGSNDHLPKNKYAIKKGQYGVMAFIIFMLAVSIFAYANIDRIIGIPSLEINIPEKKDEASHFTVSSPEFSLEGKVTDKDSVSINHEDIPVNSDGSFSKKIMLEPGLNAFLINIKRFLGKERSFAREIYYEASLAGGIPAGGLSPADGLPPEPPVITPQESGSASSSLIPAANSASSSPENSSSTTVTP